MGSEKIGFIGLGEMGKPMAKTLAKKGFKLTVYDIRTEPMEELKAWGAEVARSPRDLAEANNKIITMVRDVPQTQQVIFGERGIWEGLSQGATIIVTSTIDPLFCRELETKAKGKKIGVLDACVSGGNVGAEAGTLTIMVGGEEQLYKDCLPIFEAMGKLICHMGPVGAGQITKLANNLMGYVNAAGAVEGLALANLGGVKIDRFLEVVKKSAGNSWQIENWKYLVQRWKDRRREGKKGVTFIGMLDVMDECLSLARQLDVSLPVLALVAQLKVDDDLLNKIENG